MPYRIEINTEESTIHFIIEKLFTVEDGENLIEDWKRLIDESSFKKTLLDFNTARISLEQLNNITTIDISDQLKFLTGVRVAGIATNNFALHELVEPRIVSQGLLYRFFT